MHISSNTLEDENGNERSEFVIDFPIPEMDIEQKENDNYFALNDTDFWFNKGKETSKKGAIEPAIDLYIQGLRVNSKHYQSYHNVGGGYIYIEKCASALKYFKKANVLSPFEFKTLYALAIVSLKMGNLDQAITYIDAIKEIDVKNKDIGKELIPNLVYFEALGYKLDGDFANANQGYHTLAKILYMKEKALVVKYTIGLLLIPTLKDRHKVTNFVENLQDIMQLYTCKKEKDGISEFYDYKTNTWLKGFENNIIKYLKNCNFFSRFSEDQLNILMKIMRLKKFKTNDVLFTEEINVYVIIHGDVIMKKFENNVFPNKILALFK